MARIQNHCKSPCHYYGGDVIISVSPDRAKFHPKLGWELGFHLPYTIHPKKDLGRHAFNTLFTTKISPKEGLVNKKGYCIPKPISQGNSISWNKLGYFIPQSVSCKDKHIGVSLPEIFSRTPIYHHISSNGNDIIKLSYNVQSLVVNLAWFLCLSLQREHIHSHFKKNVFVILKEYSDNHGFPINFHI